MAIIRKLLLIILVAISTQVFALPQIEPATSDEAKLSPADLERMATVIADVKKYYYRSIDDKTIFDGAINGMLSNLDPHSAYLGPEDLKDLQMETLGKFGGIGVEVTPDQGLIKIISPLDDTPAYRAGIKSGDYILQINNNLVREMTLREAINMMRGPKGSKLTLTIIRKSENKPLTFNLRREIIKIKTVKDRMLEPGYAYIRLAAFQEPTEQDLQKIISKIKRETNNQIKGLVLDLRNNPGGLLESAVQISDDFLDVDKIKDNDLIVYTKGQDDQVQISAKITDGELLPNTPIVVLINEGSASAAEIVAGALQDHKRAILVGTRSFGKGSVQTLIPIDRTSAIKLTTALYYTPSGRSIQATGIEPDITVADIQVQKDQETQNLPRIDESTLMDHIQNGNAKDGKKSPSDNAETLKKQSKAELELAYKDYQLYEALHILKSMNVLKHKAN